MNNVPQDIPYQDQVDMVVARMQAVQAANPNANLNPFYHQLDAMDFQQRERLARATAILSNHSLQVKIANKNKMSVPATRLHYEKIAAGCNSHASNNNNGVVAAAAGPGGPLPQMPAAGHGFVGNLNNPYLGNNHQAVNHGQAAYHAPTTYNAQNVPAGHHAPGGHQG